MTAFATHFREAVIPDMRRLINQEAEPVAWETKDFTEAWRVVMDEARRRGLVHLPPHIQEELDAWVCRTLSSEVAKHMPSVMAEWRFCDEVKRHEAMIQRHYAGLDLASDYLTGALG